MNKGFLDDERAVIMSAIQTWMDNTCLEFVEIDATSTDFISFEKLFG